MVVAMDSMDSDVVPWFSAMEWKTVAELIFSKDVVKIKDGYERLRCWRARCNRLPAGIECTIIILEAVLFEAKYKEIAHDDLAVIKSVYALAITRFLNHAASFEKDKTSSSLYKIARRLNIPEWVVNLRHEAAHGSDLPSLEVLRVAVSLAIDWLYSAYWTKGCTIVNAELIRKSKLHGVKIQLHMLLEVYQELHLKKIEGIHFIGEIKNSNLLEAMEDMLRLTDDLCSDEDLVEYPKDGKMPLTIDEFTSVIISKLFHIFNTAQKNSINELNAAVDYFLEVSCFVPSVEVAGVFYSFKVPQENGITFYLKNMWEKILRDVIQKTGALPILLKKLVDINYSDDFRQKWAACWVKEISLAIKRMNMIRKEIIAEGENMKSFRRRHLSNYHITDADQLKIKRKLNSHNPEYHEISGKIALSPNHVLDLTQLIEDIISHPRNTSTIYIKELLDIYEEPLADFQKKGIVNAMNIYFLMICEPIKPLRTARHLGMEDVNGWANKEMPFRGDPGPCVLDPLPYYLSDWEGVPYGMIPWKAETDTMMDEYLSPPDDCSLNFML